MQPDFAAALLDPDRPAPEGVIRPDGTQATKRFDVYRNNVVTSLIDALGAGFPAVHALVGEDFFKAVAGVYVRQHPPTSPLMIFYGEAFPAFLRAFEPAQAVPYLADVAALERARREAYHAADDPIGDPSPLAELAADRLMETRFHLHASVRLVSSPYPVFSIWRFNMTEDKTPPAARRGGCPDRAARGERRDADPAAGRSGVSGGPTGRGTPWRRRGARGGGRTGFDLSTNLAGLFQARILSRLEIPT